MMSLIGELSGWKNYLKRLMLEKTHFLIITQLNHWLSLVAQISYAGLAAVEKKTPAR
jgi:hypothetical protein